MARLFAAATAFLIISGLAAAPALAQDTEPPVTPTSETTAPTSPEQPPVSQTPIETPTTTPAPAEPVVGTPDLRVTVSAGSGPFLLGQDIPFTVMVTNVGDAEATYVHGTAYADPSGSSAYVPIEGWEEYAAGGPAHPGGTLAAGATRKFNLVANVSVLDNGDPTIRVYAMTRGETNNGDNETVFVLPMVPPTVKGDAGGVVFGDANGNGKSDRGEGLRDVVVKLSASSAAPFEAKTDAYGRFDFTDLPARVYNLIVPSEQSGWVLAQTTRSVAVDGSDSNSDLLIRGVRPLRDVLDTKVAFGAASYKPGDAAELTVTLTNRGTKALSGIQAGCDRFGSPVHLTGWDDVARWGDLALSGHGVTVAAGETKTFPVSGIVPDGAIDFGLVSVACDFGDDQDYLSGFPSVFAQAKVPGKTIDSLGVVYYDRNDNFAVDDGEVVANTKIGLPDPVDGTIIAKASTNDAGEVRFTGIQVGWYHPVVYGPWQAADPDSFVQIPTRQTLDGDWVFRVKPGPGTQEPPDATPAPPASGSSPGGSGSGLAYTGVEVFGPLVGGAAAVFAGFLALLFARRLERRRSQD